MGHQILSDDVEEIKLKGPETPESLPAYPRKFTRTDTSEFSTNSRKLRVTMNKVTEENFQKLITELVGSLVFDEKLINEFLRLIFDRVNSKDFSELYLTILTYFTTLLKFQDTQKFKTLKSSLATKAESVFNSSPEFSLPCIKFIGHLYIENLIKSKILYTFLESENDLTEAKLEAFCTLINIVSSYLAQENPNLLNKIFTLIEAMPVSTYKKKVQFLVQGVIEKKENLLTPAEDKPKYRQFHCSPLKKKVSFMTCGEFQAVLSKGMKRILKHSVSDVVKNKLRVAVADYVKGKKALEPFQKIFEECRSKERQLVNQIFKYALIQFNREKEFLVICELACGLCEGFVNKDVVETGIAYTVEAVDDLKLDTPMADQHLIYMINYLRDHEVIKNSKYLIDHLTRSIRRKCSESCIDGCLSCDSMN